MAHRDSVADRYRVELERHATGPTNRVLDDDAHLVQMNVARHNLAKAVRNADERLFHVTGANPTGPHKRPVRRTLKASFDRITSHKPVSPKTVFNWKS